MRNYYRHLFQIGILLLSGLIFSCSSVGEISKKYGDNFVLVQEKTACYGRCAVYEVSITSNGNAVLIGRKNMDWIGNFTRKLTSDEMKQLGESLDQTDFFNYEDQYVGPATDLPTTYITLKIGEKEKRIRDYFGGPKELRNLEKVIDELVKSSGWTESK